MIMSVNFQQMPFMAILMKMIGSNTLLVRRLIISFCRCVGTFNESSKRLSKSQTVLKPGGQILITFPNLAHNSVLIDLFNNRLTWNETGLLDATHKSFYLQEGFEKVLQKLVYTLPKKILHLIKLATTKFLRRMKRYL